eukprot:gnl/Chilomastix_caulleri/1055.p1 GENE.gnl/Chilomastix_caulleri/1055~~gnl/Chilomastix_caulleri/1055.p1  ORF type:complete len:105 (+),score=29.44 gnl/Chilomastix_caulleri/1055:290-604(+)
MSACLADDNNTIVELVQLTGTLSENIRGIYTVIPSGSDPTNLGKAVRFASKGFHFMNSKTKNKCKCKLPMKLGSSTVFVRLYHDIFMVYDKGEKCWVLVRVIVP